MVVLNHLQGIYLSSLVSFSVFVVFLWDSLFVHVVDLRIFCCHISVMVVVLGLFLVVSSLFLSPYVSLRLF